MSAEALETFRADLVDRGIAVADSVFEGDREAIRRRLKAGLARVLWGEEERYQIYLEGDMQVEKALDLFDRADELVMRY